MKKIVSVFFIFFHFCSFAQQDTTAIKKKTRPPLNWVITPGLYFSNHFTGGLSVSKAYSWSSGGPGFGGHLYGAGIEFSSDGGKMIAAPKLFYEGYLTLILVRAGLIDYTDFRNSSIKFRPEIGISFDGTLSVTYGYNFALTHKDFFPLQNSLNLQYNIFIGKRKYVKVD